MMEGLQLVMQRPFDDQNIIEASTSTLVNDKAAVATWYTCGVGLRELTVPNGVKLLPNLITPENLTQRGEAVANSLSTAFLGWDNVGYKGGGSESLGIGLGQPKWFKGRLLSEYVSTNNTYGTQRMEIGVKRRLLPE
jgi:hypothetical protein